MSNQPTNDFINLVFRFIDTTLRFRECKKDEYARARVVRYGVYSIVFSVLSPLIVFLCLIGINALSASGGSVLLGLLGIIALAAVGIYCFIFFGFGAVLNAVRQLQLDKKATGIIGLALSILSLFLVALIVYNAVA